MKYKNIKTGAVIDAASEISGEDWQALPPAEIPENRKVAPVQPKRKTRVKADDGVCDN